MKYFYVKFGKKGKNNYKNANIITKTLNKWFTDQLTY